MLTAAAVRHEPPVLTDGEFTALREIIYQESGIHLTEAKRALVASRLWRRVRDLGLPSFGSYARLVEADERELVMMLDSISTNETHFFRDPRQFDLIRDRLCPEWKAAAAAGHRPRRLRVWSAACSSGEEPYSLAMLLHDQLHDERWDIEILASDLSTRVLDRGAEGIWPVAKCDPIPGAYLRRYLLCGVGPQEGKARVGTLIRDMVEFQRINLRERPYPVSGTFDVIFCRNVLIYFDAPSRETVLTELRQHITPGGYLFLGHAESLIGAPSHVRSVMPAVYRIGEPDRATVGA